jgi:hypothetical protein
MFKRKMNARQFYYYKGYKIAIIGLRHKIYGTNRSFDSSSKAKTYIDTKMPSGDYFNAFILNKASKKLKK